MIRARWALFATAIWACLSPSAAWPQDFFEALAAAYQTNPTLLAQRANLRAVNEGVPQELSNYRPFVSVESFAGAQHIDRNGPDGSERTTPFEASVGLAQPLYRGGRTVAGVARAESEVDAQRAVTARFDVYQQLASLSFGSEGDSEAN